MRINFGVGYFVFALAVLLAKAGGILDVSWAVAAIPILFPFVLLVCLFFGIFLYDRIYGQKNA